MKDNLPRYTMRIPRRTLDKLKYISQYEGRSINKQLERLVKQCISDFETKHGEITIDLIKKLHQSCIHPFDKGIFGFLL